ncbi:unnamed protein product [Agarophyton chilense]|eukprot:gb/GEZJ01000313.1/.p2 GENE.gb/GEZJ01000313.1/~~gb/GEZJ01000313.1/.p2  ORF type:complete len:423 (-),score=63.50 gb/GEZJ01000313.1/:343-1611(-)
MGVVEKKAEDDMTAGAEKTSVEENTTEMEKTTGDEDAATVEETARVDVIFNVVSGTRDPDRDLDIVREVLGKSFERVVVWQTTPEKDGRALGVEAIEDGASLLVACGGDGTVTGVAAAIHQAQNRDSKRRLVLAAVARGTANAFCTALDIPTDVQRATEMIAGGPVRRVDLPVVEVEGSNGRMLLLAGIGLEAKAVKAADRSMKRTFGMLAYGLAGLRSIWRQEKFRTTMVLSEVSDNQAFARGELQAKQVRLKDMYLRGVTVVNAAPATSVLAHGIGAIKPDDGLLEVICVSSNSPWDMVRTMIFQLRCALLRVREPRHGVYGMRARAVRVECWPPQPVVVDGEAVGRTPISVSIGGAQDSVLVVAPAAREVSRRRRRFSLALRRLWRNARGVAMFTTAVVLLRRSTPSRPSRAPWSSTCV